MHKNRSWLLLMITIVLLGRSAPVRADIAPPQPPLGSNILPGAESTQVRMVAETVLIDLPSTSPFETWHASVTAVFTMRNLGDQAESIPVGFPMFATADYSIAYGSCPETGSDFPSIQDFRALVNDQPAAVSVIEQPFSFYTPEGQLTNVNKPCWAQFLVVFPAAVDVKVEVRYRIQGQFTAHGGYTDHVSFPYILTSGAGWKDSIGSADITLRLPYEATALNVYTGTEDARLTGREISWHFEDFEPQSNVEATIVHPLIWQSILHNQKLVAANPKDGEAWGRLGKAYKQAFLFERGFREGSPGEDLFRLSQESYQESVTLLPRDADWHFGYGDLFCRTAEWWWPTSQMRLPTQEELLRSCMEQFRQALEINPRHARTLAGLEMLAWWENVVDLSGPKPDFLILTPGNYKSATPYATTSEPTAPGPTETPTPAPTKTPPPSSTPQPVPSATAEPAVIGTATPAKPPADRPNPLCGAALLPMALLALYKINKGF